MSQETITDGIIDCVAKAVTVTSGPGSIAPSTVPSVSICTTADAVSQTSVNFLTYTSVGAVVASLIAAGASWWTARRVHDRWGTDRIDAQITAAETRALSDNPREQEYGIGVIKQLFDNKKLDTVQKARVADMMLLLLPTDVPEADSLEDTELSQVESGQLEND